MTDADTRDSREWRLLVVDDLPAWADSITEMAHRLGCEVRLATNLSTADRELTQWQPHLIFLDLHMPRDKWQPHPDLREKYNPTQKTLAFCEQIVKAPEWDHVIVAIMSLERQQSLKLLAAKAGAHYYCTKGDFNVEHFQALMERVRRNNVPDPSPSS